MFGKTKDVLDGDLSGIFGDEEAADTEAQFDQLRERVEHVETQIHSQFTSMAAYAQIAQEQVELARAESRSENERAEQRLMQLIERERAERLGMPTPGSDTAASHADARLDALEQSIDVLKVGISDCLSRQKALADAITALFQPADASPASPVLPPPNIDGPIGDLSLN